jgi:hypothetical protein
VNPRNFCQAWIRRRTIWIADAHRDDGKRFVVRADEKLTAFVELESGIRTALGFIRSNRVPS